MGKVESRKHVVMKKILFLCTAHNSLSQSLYLTLSTRYSIDIEYAISDEIMTEAVLLSKPDIIVCPFLTRKVPANIYNRFMTLIVHPGPPGDAGPSSLDWVLMGDDGSTSSADEAIRSLGTGASGPGRSHWGVSIIQAIEELDAGPVWAFEQFQIDIDKPGLTKSTLYRDQVTRAAICAVAEALERVWHAQAELVNRPDNTRAVEPLPSFAVLSVTKGAPFLGGRVHSRPRLKAATRDFDVTKHTSMQISRRIRASDSQPGVLSAVFGEKLYIYGGATESSLGKISVDCLRDVATRILAIQKDAVCIAAADGLGVWITHVRRPKRATDEALWPKLPAVPVLVELGILDLHTVAAVEKPDPFDLGSSDDAANREIWIELDSDKEAPRIAYLHFEFYNGAMSTARCLRLKQALEYILRKHEELPVSAVVLMGGTFFGNGIALNVIEAADDPFHESCANIKAINEVVRLLLWELPRKKIVTFAALRGNAAAGGVAMAAACDYAIAGAEVVLNPSYRAMSLYGSEYHSISYLDRCGEKVANEFLQDIGPMSPVKAREIGLVDAVFPGSGDCLDDRIVQYVTHVIHDGHYRAGRWKRRTSINHDRLQKVNGHEMRLMRCNFKSAEYNARRAAFVRKYGYTATPLSFAKHRRRYSDRGSVALGHQAEQIFTDDMVLDIPECRATATRFGCYYTDDVDVELPKDQLEAVSRLEDAVA